MSEHASSSRGHEAFVFMSGLVLGLAVGLAFGILTAPHSGSVTRRKIWRNAGEAKDQVAEAIDELEETGKDFLKEVKRAVK